MSQEFMMDINSSENDSIVPRVPISVVKWSHATAMFFWSDGTQSEFDFNEYRFLVNKSGFDANGCRKNQPDYPKRLISILEVNSGTRYGFWDDRTYSVLGPLRDTFNYIVTDSSSSEWWEGWPEGQTVNATCSVTEDSLVYICFFWADGSYGKFSWNEEKFISSNLPQSALAKGWPVNKKLIGAVNANPREIYLFWEDSTYNAWGVDGLSECASMTSLPGWPCEAFTPDSHEIEDVRVNNNIVHSTIYINDVHLSEVAVNIWVKVRNKANGEYIKVSDCDWKGNALIMLYDYQLGPEGNRRSYLDLDGVGGRNFSKEWTISRLPMADKKAVGVSQYDNSITNAISNAPTSVDSYFDGWNRFTYYVTTTEPTTIKQLAARVGGVGTYQYTGSDGLDEYANITAKKR
jgi:hypothetical protein